MTSLRSQITSILASDMTVFPDGYFIHGAIDKLVSLVETEAVAFAEWIQKDGYVLFLHGWATMAGGTCLTNEQLYKKYKESI